MKIIYSSWGPLASTNMGELKPPTLPHPRGRTSPRAFTRFSKRRTRFESKTCLAGGTNIEFQPWVRVGQDVSKKSRSKLDDFYLKDPDDNKKPLSTLHSPYTLPSWELTHTHTETLLSRWFSFCPGGICYFPGKFIWTHRKLSRSCVPAVPSIRTWNPE